MGKDVAETAASGSSSDGVPQPAAGAATPVVNPTASAPTGPVHCPYRRTTDLLQRLAPKRCASVSLSAQAVHWLKGDR